MWLSDNEKKVYDTMKRDLVLSLEGREIDALNAAALSNKLLQMANGAVYADDGSVARIHDHKLDILRERYSQAIEYMAWFEPAWSSLTDTKQHIISEFYMGDNQKAGATYRLMSEFSYSESHIERLRSNALNHLRSMLFG